ncbi:MAG: PAS domain-containing protein, partial [Acetobacterium sp.]|nr:PAS domain-containing protein [Acetobacterium sp.]
MNDIFSLNEKSKQLLNGFFSVSLDFLCITDEQGIIMKTNPLWETKLGYLIPELLGKKLIDFIHPNDLASLVPAIKKLSAENESLALTSRLRSKVGSYRVTHWQFQWVDGLVFSAAKDLTEL